MNVAQNLCATLILSFRRSAALDRPHPRSWRATEESTVGILVAGNAAPNRRNRPGWSVCEATSNPTVDSTVARRPYRLGRYGCALPRNDMLSRIAPALRITSLHHSITPASTQNGPAPLHGAGPSSSSHAPHRAIYSRGGSPGW
jgi:hypothetical protein